MLSEYEGGAAAGSKKSCQATRTSEMHTLRVHINGYTVREINTVVQMHRAGTTQKQGNRHNQYRLIVSLFDFGLVSMM